MATAFTVLHTVLSTSLCDKRLDRDADSSRAKSRKICPIPITQSSHIAVPWYCDKVLDTQALALISENISPLVSSFFSNKTLQSLMADIPMNAKTADVKALLCLKEDDWDMFQAEARYEHDIHPEIYEDKPWNELNIAKKKVSIARLAARCTENNVSAAASEWALHHRHVAWRLWRRGKGRPKPAANTSTIVNQPPTALRFDPVKDAAEAAKR